MKLLFPTIIGMVITNTALGHFYTPHPYPSKDCAPLLDFEKIIKTYCKRNELVLTNRDLQELHHKSYYVEEEKESDSDYDIKSGEKGEKGEGEKKGKKDSSKKKGENSEEKDGGKTSTHEKEDCGCKPILFYIVDDSNNRNETFLQTSGFDRQPVTRRADIVDVCSYDPTTAPAIGEIQEFKSYTNPESGFDDGSPPSILANGVVTLYGKGKKPPLQFSYTWAVNYAGQPEPEPEPTHRRIVQAEEQKFPIYKQIVGGNIARSGFGETLGPAFTQDGIEYLLNFWYLCEKKVDTSGGLPQSLTPYGEIACQNYKDDGAFFRRIFRDLEEDFDPPIHRALEIIDGFAHRGAKSDAAFSFKHDVISKESCQKLVKYMDDSIASETSVPTSKVSKEKEPGKDSWFPFTGGLNNQYNKKLYADDILKLIGPEETHKVLDFFHESFGEDMTIDCMYLAYHGFNPDDNLYYAPWHIDDYFTMEILLNDDFDGGDVVHLTNKGAEKLDARVGTATAHGPDIVHGITSNENGAKYMLILKHHDNRPDKKDVVRISKEIVDQWVMNEE